MAMIRVTILGIKSEMTDGGGVVVRNDDPIADYQFNCEPEETLRSVFKRYGYPKIGRSGTFLRIKEGGQIQLDYMPTDCDVIEQYFQAINPYPF